jgi:hypothetical protein
MADGWVNLFGEMFQSPKEIVDGQWSGVSRFSEVFEPSKRSCRCSMKERE